MKIFIIFLNMVSEPEREKREFLFVAVGGSSNQYQVF